jgi:hypothetical protein
MDKFQASVLLFIKAFVLLGLIVLGITHQIKKWKNKKNSKIN